MSLILRVSLFVKQTTQQIHTKYLIACGGLHSDRLAKMSGADPNPKIVPFRGEYLLLRPEKRHLARGNIYPASIHTQIQIIIR